MKRFCKALKESVSFMPKKNSSLSCIFPSIKPLSNRFKPNLLKLSYSCKTWNSLLKKRNKFKPISFKGVKKVNFIKLPRNILLSKKDKQKPKMTKIHKNLQNGRITWSDFKNQWELVTSKEPKRLKLFTKFWKKYKVK